jgi:hypothetical protein
MKRLLVPHIVAKNKPPEIFYLNLMELELMELGSQHTTW